MGRQLIVGPPGTGKTTTLLGEVEAALGAGIPPERIAYLAFTRAAANEARDRAIERFGLEPERFPLFRTIHSLAYAQLSLKRSDVMAWRQWTEFGEEFGCAMPPNAGGDMPEHPWDAIPYGNSSGAKLMRMYHTARALRVPMHMLCDRVDVPDWYARKFESALADFKDARGLLDFHDMLATWTPRIEADLLIVDEAQDLSPEQWRHVRAMADQVPEAIAGGDDDQSIFGWAGANPAELIGLEWERRVLPVSHRVPAEHRDLAEFAISHVEQRIPKQWRSANTGGNVHAASIDSTDAWSDGEWLVLARTVKRVRALEPFARATGRPYSINGVSSVATPAARAVLAWEGLRAGRDAPGGDIQALLRFVRGTCVERGSRASRSAVALEDPDLWSRPWYDALAIPEYDATYLRAVLRAGHSLRAEPTLRLMTVHQSKGLEADNVWLDATPAKLSRDTDEEARVWYVGLTRARRELYVHQPHGNAYIAQRPMGD